MIEDQQPNAGLPVKTRKPRAKKKEPPKRHKAMVTAVAALVVAATDFFLTLRYGLKLF